MDYKRKSELTTAYPSHKQKKAASASLNKRLVTKDTVDYLINAWISTSAKLQLKPPDDLNVEVISEPYKLCIARQFLSDSEYVQELKCELFKLEFMYKRNDLYQYHQTADLSVVNLPAINGLKDWLKGECRDWLQEVTGKELNNKLTINCSAYNYTDHLLCHDDQTEDRVIAFVLYLNSEAWTEANGGQLQIFNADINNQPLEVVRSIAPEYNSFVFFEVASKSFHQVAEVLTADRTRLSINGWFHGKSNLPSPAFNEPLLASHFPVNEMEFSGETFINPIYLDTVTQTKMSTHFEQESEILLTDFLEPSQYMSIALGLQSDTIQWTLRGPVNRRNYHVAKEETLPITVQGFIQFLKSKEMFQILQNYTKLDLANQESEESSSLPRGGEIGPRCTVEVQRWMAGCYTLVHDNDSTINQQALDLNMYINAESVESYHGGFISYIARDDDEELLTVIPQGNALALTFRDTETLRFVKYINNRLNEEDLFHTISLTYFE